MQEFQQKKKFKKALYSWWSLLIVIILFLIMVKAVWGVYKKEELSRMHLEATREEYAKLKEREKVLAGSVAFLESEEGIEAEIRQKFRLVRPGEEIAVIVEDDTELAATTTARASWYKRWYRGFKGMFAND